MNSKEFDRIYKETALENIPWNIEELPQAISDLLENEKIIPCNALDVGCGTGNYSTCLAQKGFNVTGIDFSAIAINLAKEKALKKEVKCNFQPVDVLADMDVLKEKFDFAFDWEVLHHIFPQRRKQFIQNIHSVLSEGGKYLSVCFSEEDEHFGGGGKVRKTPIGTTLYFSSEDELIKLFDPFFSIIELKTIEIPGKTLPHKAIYAFLEKD